MERTWSPLQEGLLTTISQLYERRLLSDAEILKDIAEDLI